MIYKCDATWLNNVPFSFFERKEILGFLSPITFSLNLSIHFLPRFYNIYLSKFYGIFFIISKLSLLPYIFFIFLTHLLAFLMYTCIKKLLLVFRRSYHKKTLLLFCYAALNSPFFLNPPPVPWDLRLRGILNPDSEIIKVPVVFRANIHTSTKHKHHLYHNIC